MSMWLSDRVEKLEKEAKRQDARIRDLRHAIFVLTAAIIVTWAVLVLFAYVVGP